MSPSGWRSAGLIGLLAVGFGCGTRAARSDGAASDASGPGGGGANAGAGVGGADPGARGGAAGTGTGGVIGPGGGTAGTAANAGAGGAGGTPGNAGTGGDCSLTHPTLGQGTLRDAVPGDGEAWISYGPAAARVNVDVRTRLAWFRADIQDPLNVSFAFSRQFCEELEVAGIAGWRMATISEVRDVAAGCPATQPGGSCPIADPECAVMSCGTGATCESCAGDQGPGGGGRYYRPDVFLYNWFLTSTRCTDCAVESYWIYQARFGAFEVERGGTPRNTNHLVMCVASELPADAIPSCVVP